MDKEKMIERFYFNWLDNLGGNFSDESKAYQKVIAAAPKMEKSKAIAHDDAINDYGAIVQRNAFIGGFETCLNLLNILIGGNVNG